MARNCSKDISGIIDIIDRTLLDGDPGDKQDLKDSFGLGTLEHDDDFAYALMEVIGSWQDIQFDPVYSNDNFFTMCDAVENVSPDSKTIPDAEGVYLVHALEGFATWFRSRWIPGCTFFSSVVSSHLQTFLSSTACTCLD